MKALKVVISIETWIFLTLCFIKRTKCDNNKVIKYSSTSKSLQNDFKFDTFFKIHDKYLNATIFKTLQAKTYKQCLADCVAKKKCISFNFAEFLSSDGLHLCEMLETDLFNATSTNFNYRADYLHFTRKTECLLKPCQAGFLCLPDYVGDKYTCKTCKEMEVPEGLSEWGEWSKCDKLCVPGKKRRQKTCSNAKAICNPCTSAEALTLEENDCYYCPPESPIRAAEGFGSYLCVQPKSGDCNPIENQTTWTHGLVWKLADKSCSAEYMKFLFDADGIIYHKCSGKIVCPHENRDYPNSQRLVLIDKCSDDIAKHKRLPSHSLQHVKSGICVHTYLGVPKVDGFLIYNKNRCDEERLMLIFFKLSNP